MDTVTHPVRAATDHGRIWPSAAAILIALFVICGYGSQMDLAYLSAFALGTAGVLCGLFHLIRRRVRAGACWLVPWTVFIILMLPVAYPARMAVFDAGNSIRFFVHQQNYQREVHKSGNEKISSKLWRLGIQGADEIYLLYDSTDDPTLADRLLNNRGSCSTRRNQVKTHFQVITISC